MREFYMGAINLSPYLFYYCKRVGGFEVRLRKMPPELIERIFLEAFCKKGPMAHWNSAVLVCFLNWDGLLIASELETFFWQSYLDEQKGRLLYKFKFSPNLQARIYGSYPNVFIKIYK